MLERLVGLRRQHQPGCRPTGPTAWSSPPPETCGAARPAAAHCASMLSRSLSEMSPTSSRPWTNRRKPSSVGSGRPRWVRAPSGGRAPPDPPMTLRIVAGDKVMPSRREESARTDRLARLDIGVDDVPERFSRERSFSSPRTSVIGVIRGARTGHGQAPAIWVAGRSGARRPFARPRPAASGPGRFPALEEYAPHLRSRGTRHSRFPDPSGRPDRPPFRPWRRTSSGSNRAGRGCQQSMPKDRVSPKDSAIPMSCAQKKNDRSRKIGCRPGSKGGRPRLGDGGITGMLPRATDTRTDR